MDDSTGISFDDDNTTTSTSMIVLTILSLNQLVLIGTAFLPFVLFSSAMFSFPTFIIHIPCNFQQTLYFRPPNIHFRIITRGIITKLKKIV